MHIATNSMSQSSIPNQLNLKQRSHASIKKQISPKFKFKQPLECQTLKNIQSVGGLNQKSQIKKTNLNLSQQQSGSYQSFSFTKKKKNGKQLKKQNGHRNSFKIDKFEKKSSINLDFKTMFKKQKIQNIAKKFIRKLKRLKMSKNSQIKLSNEQEQENFEYIVQGVQLSESNENLIDLFFLIFNFISIFLITIILGFKLFDVFFIQFFETVILILGCIQIIYKSCVVKSNQENKIKYLYLIFYNYLKQDFILDLFFILVIVLCKFKIDDNINYLKIVILIKLPWMLDKLEKIQIHLTQSSYWQQYWSVFKVFFFNFCYAHFLALILNFVGNLHPENSWFTNKSICIGTTPWYQIYIWSYYWAVNIMLTVGFGDINAVIYQQALVLIFIQILSCIVLAYNINFVGVLIAKIRQQDYQKAKKLKIFRGLAIRNKVSNDLFRKMANHILQSCNIKKKFNIQEENQFVNNLPIMYKNQFLVESSKYIFQNIDFFRHLSTKTVKKLAQSIQTIVTHPNQIIFNKDNYRNLKILRQGIIGYCINKTRSSINGRIMDKLQIKEGQMPSILGIHFIYNIEPNYEIKSLKYSIIHSIQQKNLIQAIKSNKVNYEYYCFLKDQHRCNLTSITNILCQNCNQNHTKFQCPKQHLILISQYTLFKYLHKLKNDKNKRVQFDRIIYQNINALSIKWPQNKLIIQQNAIRKRLKSVNFIELNMSSKNKIIHETSSQVNKYIQPNRQYQKRTLNHSYKKQIRYSNYQIQDELWLIKLDILEDYTNYFSSDNPNNLINKNQKIISSNLLRKNKYLQYEAEDEIISNNSSFISQKQYINDETYLHKQTFQQQVKKRNKFQYKQYSTKTYT